MLSYRCTDKNCSIIKYADDSVITGYLFNDTSDSYVHEIQNSVDWCKRNYLVLNVKKTKELVFDFRKKTCVHNSITLNGEEIEQVHSYKYLGTTIDDKLTFSDHVKLSRSKLTKDCFSSGS